MTKNTIKYLRKYVAVLVALSDKLALNFLLKRFVTPTKFKTPNREKPMYNACNKHKETLPQSNKEIIVYTRGDGDKKALLVHGWNGRATQLFSIADLLLNQGYSIVAFDAPGHGDSKKSSAKMLDFMEAVFHISQKYGEFEVIVGHSLGAMTTVNCLGRGLKTKKAIVIGGGNKIEDVIQYFVKFWKVPDRFRLKLKEKFEQKIGENIENYDAYQLAQKIEIPVLVLHDKDDKDVPYTDSENVCKHLIKGELMLTEKLGHRKILGDKAVLQKISNFVG